MDYSKLGLFSLIQQKMAYIGERQSVLAENIANTDTPKYKAKDLKAVKFDRLLAASTGKLQMTATDPRHIQPAGGGGSFAVETPKSWDTKPDGNTVDPVEQAGKMSDNSADYQSITNIYAKMADLLRTVIADK